MKALKVYGGRYYGKETNYQHGRMIVSAYTKKQIREIANISASELNNYWTITGNEKELKLANEIGCWIFDAYGNLICRLK